ncbi:DUF2683 family protein [Mucilaginibacter terrae]|uniref:DUF2683 family protein n=1 Tax=Mucilaginibacter terrae TaxID=1955052 RepID=UPI0036434700
MELLLKNVQQEHLALIAELAKTLNIEIQKKSDSDKYDPKFVTKILKGDEDRKAGRGTKVDVDTLWK